MGLDAYTLFSLIVVDIIISRTRVRVKRPFGPACNYARENALNARCNKKPVVDKTP